VIALLQREPRALAFGLLQTVAATVGQTFVIALFLPGIKASFALSDAEVSLLFTGTTLVSAAAVWKIGAWLDRTDVVRYSLACGVLLAFACALIAAAREIVILTIGLFCLRLAGNGLLTHVALTATARYFIRDRGQALSLVLLGSSVGEAALPATLVALIGAWGWRWTFVAAGALSLALVGAAAAIIRTDAAFRAPHAQPKEVHVAPAARSRTSAALDPRRYFACTGALFVVMPLVITATVFHQALLAELKGLSLQWFAVSFVAFAISRVSTSLVTGPLADRIGSDGLFRVHLVPLAVGIAALVVFDGAWVAPFFWTCAGVTSGMGGVLQTTVVAERVPAAHLGTARSVLMAVTIVASAVGPSLYGAGLAAGAQMAAILWASAALLAGATALGWIAAGPAHGRPAALHRE
jgi:MFS family permease